MTLQTTDVCIIGAGPAGAVAAGLLRRQGLAVTVLERQAFPRFSIGESLLPQSMAFIEKAGFLQDVVEAGFQYKNGAAFCRGDKRTAFDFRDKFTDGWATTYQVQRAHFDQVLANGAAKAGADVRYRHEVTAVRVAPSQRPQLDVQPLDGGAPYTVEAGHLLDASGFGRTLPRLLDLESPSAFPVRAATFTHVQDRISDPSFDRSKILVTVHPQDVDVWFWTIPFSNGRCSLGVVARAEYFERFPEDPTERLKAVVAETPSLATLLQDAVWDTPANRLQGYAANVKSLWGPGYALLGNAGEFLDPVFSSGVTIAVKSADLAVTALLRERAGEAVDWEADYARPLRAGVDAFRAFVESWYRGGFQDVIFHEHPNPDIRRMISSILAGYAWDLSNPYVAHPERMRTLEQLCAP
ncbi:NAD(P)/FAD-dependent oxidoreductase [Pelomonas sp. Root1444]|uniref:NAD(P)/FAD-dependent oxidoreductase n=1 Tax=Pelomonas sp. Root1444 TaxID=1736464 RepID=UPI0007025093|nr:tryptophan 7-halogenase [Pelomonas sp. Root1444]KQY90635.1 FAD-dependent oxidoreductase [Pelomonas sp. Root1444]